MVVTQGDTGQPRDVTEERRAVIVNAAEELLAVHGFDALRLRDIAKAAGVSIGLIQHYFPTRDEVLYETMRVASKRRVDQWSSLGDSHQSSADKLAALLEGSIRDRHRCVIWLETCAAATRHTDLLPDVQATQHAWHAAIRDAIDRGIANNEFTAMIPVSEIVDVLVSLIDGLIVECAIQPGDGRDEYRMELLHKASRRLLGSDPS